LIPIPASLSRLPQMQIADLDHSSAQFAAVIRVLQQSLQWS